MGAWGLKIKSKRYHDRSHNLSVNIRLRKRGSKPTHAEVIAALNYMLDKGRVPKGWQFAVIDWQRPHHVHSRGWHTGDIDDMQNLSTVIRAMLPNARIGVVRK